MTAPTLFLRIVSLDLGCWIFKGGSASPPFPHETVEPVRRTAPTLGEKHGLDIYFVDSIIEMLSHGL